MDMSQRHEHFDDELFAYEWLDASKTLPLPRYLLSPRADQQHDIGTSPARGGKGTCPCDRQTPAPVVLACASAGTV